MISTRDILSKLIRYDTTSRHPNKSLIDYVAQLLEDHGISSTIIPNADGTKANLYCTIGPENIPGVMLSGHTDPSGKEELNDNLAQQRAFSVQDKLIALGINANNISVQSFGATQATAQFGEVDQYPLDRKVSVEFIDSLSYTKSELTSDSLVMQF